MYLITCFYGIKYKKWGGQDILFGVEKIERFLSRFWIAYFLILSGQRKKTPVVVWM